MRTSVPLILCLSMLAACSREAAAPEMSNAPPRADAPAAVPPPAVPTEAPTTTGAVPEAALTLVTSGVPQPFLADASSRTLYYVEGDTDGSKCTGTCLETWPPVLVEDGFAPTASSALTGSVAVLERAEGTRQLAYNGHPLYRYAGDAAVGRMAGHGVQDQWGQWHALAADGSPLPALAAAGKAVEPAGKPASEPEEAKQ